MEYPMDLGQTLLAQLFSLFPQETRLIELETALPSGALIVERFSGREALSEPFRFEVDCLSAPPHLDGLLPAPSTSPIPGFAGLAALIGEELTLRLRQADGQRVSVSFIFRTGINGGCCHGGC